MAGFTGLGVEPQRIILMFLLPPECTPGTRGFDGRRLTRLFLFHPDAWWASLARRGLQVPFQGRPSGKYSVSSHWSDALWQRLRADDWTFPDSMGQTWNIKDQAQFQKLVNFVQDTKQITMHRCPCMLLFGNGFPQLGLAVAKILCSFTFRRRDIEKMLQAEQHAECLDEDYSCAEFAYSASVDTPCESSAFALRLQLCKETSAVDGAVQVEWNLSVVPCLRDPAIEVPVSQTQLAVEACFLKGAANQGHIENRFFLYDDFSPEEVRLLNCTCRQSLAICAEDVAVLKEGAEVYSAVVLRACGAMPHGKFEAINRIKRQHFLNSNTKFSKMM